MAPPAGGEAAGPTRAEQALPRAEVNQEAFDGLMASVREMHDIVKSDDSAKTVADMIAMGAALGLTAR